MKRLAFLLALAAGCGPAKADRGCAKAAKVYPCDVDRYGHDWCLSTSHCRKNTR